MSARFIIKDANHFFRYNMFKVKSTASTDQTGPHWSEVIFWISVDKNILNNMDHNESPPSIRINPTVALNGPEEHLLDEIRQVIRECLVFCCVDYNDIKTACDLYFFNRIFKLLLDPNTPGCWISIPRRWLSSKTSNAAGSLEKFKKICTWKTCHNIINMELVLLISVIFFYFTT